MSNLNKKILLFFMVVAVSFGLVGCTNPDNSVRIRFNAEEFEIRQNETKLLEPTIIKSSQVGDIELVFTSSDESVVKVENGVLVPVSMGEAVVKVAWANRDIIFDKVVVKVIKASLPTPIIAYNTSMLKGATQTVSVNLGTQNLTDATYSFVALTPEVATISEEGVITALAVGNAKFELVVKDSEEAEKYELAVKVEESDFAIKYNLDGGVNDSENPAGYSALKLPLPLKEATKVGYTFLGWFENETKVTEIAAGRLGDVELDAKWEAVQYTLSYKGHDNATFEEGYQLPTSYTIESEDLVLGTPSKVGYKFLGWFNGYEKVEKVAKGSTGDLELEAKWEVVEYTISYDCDGGKWDIYLTSAEFGAAFLADFNNVCGTSFTLTNWYADATSIKTFFGKEEVLVKYNWFLKYMRADVEQYNTKSNSNVNNALSVLDEMIKGDTSVISGADNGPARTLIRSYIAGIMNSTQGSIGQEKYNSTYTAYVPDFSEKENQEALMNAYFVAKGYYTKYTVEQEITLGSPVKVGYTFLGWYNGEDKVEKIAKGSTGDVTLTAKWEVVRYSITYSYDGGSIKAATTLAEFEAAFWPAFAKWHNYSGSIEEFKTAVMADWKSFNLYAANGKNVDDEKYFINDPSTPQVWKNWFNTLVDQWLKINPSQDIWSSHYVGYLRIKEFFEGEQTTNWKSNVRAILYATYTPEQSATYTILDEVTLLTPEKVGYTFLGWFNGDEKVEKIEKGSTGNVTLTAKWEAVKYTISYELNGGVNAESNPTEYTIESENIVLANPTKDGFKFAGWTEGTGIVQGSTGNKTFTATWVEIPVHTVTWDLNGGTLEEGAVLVTSYREGTPVALPTLTRYAHEFLGWYEGDVKVTEIKDKSYELVAKWKNVNITTSEFSIEYELNGGNWQEGKVPDAEHAMAESFGYVPVKEGYEFDGWVSVSDNESNPPKVVLSAKWKIAQNYYITYDLDGGENAKSNPTKFDAATSTFTLLAATKSGYKFLGWFDEDDQEVKQVEQGTTKDLTLTAKWEVVEYSISYVNTEGVSFTEGYQLPTKYTVESGELVLAAPAKDGYEFLGWFDEDDQKVDKVAVEKLENLTYTAKWNKLVTLTKLAVSDEEATVLEAVFTNLSKTVIAFVKVDLEENYYELTNANLTNYVNVTVKGCSTLAAALKYAKDENLQGVIYIAAGTYEENVTLDLQGTTLVGANYGVAGKAKRVEESAISGKITITANNVELNGIKITGGTNSDNTAPVSLCECENVKIQNCLFDALYGTLDSTLYKNNRKGMISHLYTDNNVNTIKNIVISNNKFDFSGHSSQYCKTVVLVNSVDTLTITDNEVIGGCEDVGKLGYVYNANGSSVYVWGNSVDATKLGVVKGTKVESAE